MRFTKKALCTVLAAGIVTAAMNVTAATGVVTADVLNVRNSPSMEGGVIAQVYQGAGLDVKGLTQGWYQINYNGTTAYVSPDYVRISIIGTGCVVGEAADLRVNAAWESPLAERLEVGTQISVTDTIGDFYEVLYKGQIRYIPAVCTDVRRESLTAREETVSGKGRQAVAAAQKYLGVPYVYGGSSPAGFDCSGLTSYVYRELGVSLPRTASGQAGYGIEVSRDSLQPGDLVFFNTSGGISHVGIYTGDGQMIHSPYPGTRVSYASIHSDYYRSRYVTARRVVR